MGFSLIMSDRFSFPFQKGLNKDDPRTCLHTYLYLSPYLFVRAMALERRVMLCSADSAADEGLGKIAEQ